MNQDPSSFAIGRARPLAAALDYRSLVAALAAYQASTRTALVALRLRGSARPAPAGADALADVIEGRPGWTAAVAALAGHFHAGAAQAAGGEGSASMPGQRS